jgi:hypothetical protein
VTQQAVLINPNNQCPLLVDPYTGVIQLPSGNAAGDIICEELKATGVIWTVPAGKTFYGALVLLVAGPPGGVVTVTDANSVVWADVNSPGVGAPIVPVIIGVTIAGGGGGNALTVADSSSGAPNSVLLAGYYK